MTVALGNWGTPGDLYFSAWDNPYVGLISSDTMYSGFMDSTKYWHDVKVSRSSAVTYTNYNKYPIEVFIYLSTGTSTINLGGNSFTYNWTVRPIVRFIVPYFKSYSITSTTIYQWWELY